MDSTVTQSGSGSLESFKFSIPVVIAVLTFLWYRRGRLWKFYYMLLDETINQFEIAKIDREKWEDIAIKQRDVLVSEFFGVLCQFEIDFLRWLIYSNRHIFWETDRSGSVRTVTHSDHILAREHREKEITDEKSYCEFHIGKIFFWKFFLFGAGLFFTSIFWTIFLKQRGPGFTEIIEIRKMEKTNGDDVEKTS